MRKSKLFLSKPVYTGMTILENSKLLMYESSYNNLKKQYGQKCELLYTDTDSFLLEIETDDIYKDMGPGGCLSQSLFDASDYPKDHPLHLETNKKVLGKMKDECVCLRPKMYSIIRADEKNIKKAKGLKKYEVKKKKKTISCKSSTKKCSSARSSWHME